MALSAAIRGIVMPAGNTPMPEHASQIETRAGLSPSFTYRSHGNTFYTYLYVRVEGMCREREREGERDIMVIGLYRDLQRARRVMCSCGAKMLIMRNLSPHTFQMETSAN